jgi:phosphoribosylanthranilate isomerase
MWIKVCGIRDCDTALRLAEMGVDAVGLNFYSRSPRVVAIEQATEITNALPAEVECVGVFVNHPIRHIEAIAAKCRLDVLQLHGDEPPSYLAELHRRLPRVRLIRAWRMGRDRLESLNSYLNECQQWDCRLTACLVDAQATGVYGGSGKTVPWGRLARVYPYEKWPPLILAGGLNSTNVAEAISTTHPWGVDVASGVESSPGVKDLDLVRQFIANARSEERQEQSVSDQVDD